MSPTRRSFVTQAVALPVALAGLSSRRINTLIEIGLAAEAAPAKAARGVLVMAMEDPHGPQLANAELRLRIFANGRAEMVMVDNIANDERLGRVLNLDADTALAIWNFVFEEPGAADRLPAALKERRS